MQELDTDLKIIIGSNIFNLRKKYDLSQEDFANKLDNVISAGHVSRIEAGINAPSAEIIRAISLTFNVPSDYLLSIIIPKLVLESEIKIIDKYRSLSIDSQQVILKLLEILPTE